MQELSAPIFQMPVAVRVVDIDRYERTVGRIYIDVLDVSAELVRLGAPPSLKRRLPPV